MTRCSQYGCWIELQTAMPSPSGAAMNACGSMANWVTIGNVVRALDDDVRLARRRPRRRPSRSGARAGRWSPASGSSGPQRRVLDERRAGGERRGDRDDAPAAPRTSTRDQRGRLLGRVEGLGRDRRHRLAVVLRLADREHRPVASNCGPKRGIGCGRSAAVMHEPDAGHGQRGASCRSRRSAPARTSSGHELDVERVVEVDVGDVRLLPGDASEAADPRPGDVADAVPVIAARPRRPASTPGRRCPPRLRAGRRARCPPRRPPTASMICSYPAQRQRLPARPSSISARVGCGSSASSACADDQLARDAEAALHGARVQERLLERVVRPFHRRWESGQERRRTASGTPPRASPTRCARAWRR